MVVDCPRIAFAALRGNSGKTFLTVGVTACLTREGKAISPFKKGPDYIDAAWLTLAAGSPCYNLDAFLMESNRIISSFNIHTKQADGAVIEGNRGLFDGMDSRGNYSTAELAKMLQTPIVLIIDCSMATRTLAALVLGCQHFDPEAEIKGVILNRVGGSRHEAVIRTAVQDTCGIPVLGAIPKIKGEAFPERHMGLIPPQEHPGAMKSVEKAAGIVEQYLDMERIWGIAVEAPPFILNDNPPVEMEKETTLVLSNRPKIGFIRDSAFWFYYPDNLEALERLGAEMVECSALYQEELPPIDALYIGGGFPETHAKGLADNVAFRKSLHKAVEDGLPVYAECGGLMYLGEKLVIGDTIFPMTGVFPLTFALEKRPQAHGYTLLEVERSNPYFRKGETLHGHEFHYSKILDTKEGDSAFAFKVSRGYGIDGISEGLCYKNVLATYSHLHALGTEQWAAGLFDQACKYKEKSDKKREATSLKGRQFHTALNF